MVSVYPSWNLDYTTRREITSRWLEEEERLLRKCILQFFDVVRVITAYCNYLFDLWSNSKTEKGG